MIDGLKVSAIITCAGRGVRFGGNKLLVTLGGMTVLEKSVRNFIVDPIDEVIVTVSAENEAEYRKILVDDAQLPVQLVVGAEERHLSAQKGLDATTGDIIVVHDGVRPFATEDLIAKVIDGAVEHGAAMLGMPSTVQVKLVSDEQFVEGSLDRAHSWLGQTPQAFRREHLQNAYDAALRDAYARVSDDADLVAEYSGIQVKIYEGSVDNIKITTPQDLGTARMIADDLEPRAIG